MLIKQTGSHYITTDFNHIWAKASYILYTRIKSLLLHSTSAPPQSHVITTISSSYRVITITYTYVCVFVCVCVWSDLQKQSFWAHNFWLQFWFQRLKWPWNAFLLNRLQAKSITTCSSSLFTLRNIIKNKVSFSNVQKKHTM